MKSATSGATSSRRSRRGRDFDLEGVDAIIQVRPQDPFAQGPGDLLVGGGDQPEVGLERLGAAQRAELPLLEDAQEPGLERRGHFRDLVEEERSARRRGEHAGEIVHRAGESPFHVAE